MSTLPFSGTQADASSTWRDVDAVNLCALICNAGVASILGGEPMRGDLEGVSGPACIYQYTPDGGTTVHSDYASLIGEDRAAVSLDLARNTGGQPGAGLEADACLRLAEGEGQYHLTAVRDGDFGFELTTLDDEAAVQLAELVFERLP